MIDSHFKVRKTASNSRTCRNMHAVMMCNLLFTSLHKYPLQHLQGMYTHIQTQTHACTQTEMRGEAYIGIHTCPESLSITHTHTHTCDKCRHLRIGRSVVIAQLPLGPHSPAAVTAFKRQHELWVTQTQLTARD